MCVSENGRTRGAQGMDVNAYMCKSILRLGTRKNRHSCSRCNHLKHEQVSEPVSGRGKECSESQGGKQGLPMFKKVGMSYWGLMSWVWYGMGIVSLTLYREVV